MIKWRYGKLDEKLDGDKGVYWAKVIQALANEDLDIMKYLKSSRYSPKICKRRIEKLEFGEGPND